MSEMRDNLISKLSAIYKDNEAPLVFYFTDEEAEFVADSLIANGIIAPPCKVGDTVYCYQSDFDAVLPYFVENMNIAYNDASHNLISYEANCRNEEESELLDCIDFDLEDIGKTVFLTKEAAEQISKEMKK